MSYGIWRRRGKGWASIEIDSPGGGTHMADLRASARASLESRLRAAGIGYDEYHSDVASLRFELNHRDREIVSHNFGGGEHATWIAFDTPEALVLAVTAATESPIERAWVIKREAPSLAIQVPPLAQYPARPMAISRSQRGLPIGGDVASVDLLGPRTVDKIQATYGLSARVLAVKAVCGTIGNAAGDGWHPIDLEFPRWGQRIGRTLTDAIFETIATVGEGGAYRIRGFCLELIDDVRRLRRDNHSIGDYAQAADYWASELFADGEELRSG